MCYTITVKIYQTNTNAWFDVIEQTVWGGNGGHWSKDGDKHVLTMDDTGVSGILRFRSCGEYFIVALGVHGWQPWVDVSTGLAAKDTACSIHSDYYVSNRFGRVSMKERQLKAFDVTGLLGCAMEGRRIQVQYVVSEGEDLVANIIIH